MKNSSGFTPMELVIVVAILAMVIVAAGAMTVRPERQGVVLAVDQLCADIQLARVMAIKHKQTCAIVFSPPPGGQWHNTISNQSSTLAVSKGSVRFLAEGPDGRSAASQIVFNRRGMSSSVVPQALYLSDERLSRIYRIQVRLPGGIGVHRWDGEQWQ